ncbi:BTB/POZ protein [Rhizophagus irregularis DAOM 181602=DAOM 197198]|uniref:BTB/POZ protein n=1 Tax=Rhizophagus irregularis (strain DAOM 181602 / DAOM 197198 / MUCL 43194) TaxID=747089 RepID=A0A2P4PM97_RHIID|nr:BTB/POZ protein [Rhizophagus irregularis DAOM 181602=DAOM 197198]POG66499.1 BTB/POZ protein [Rhizophagus irregularis DAOM 181602=DAOM 197198]|eukprot:XP_025173365.1 BTB/POZ protein [Rhizophagus irregularis DAOM 181602=DAOM 197198]
MSYHLLQKLSRDLNKIFETKAYYDVIIRVGDNTETKEFQAHSLILRARVPYFHQYLQSDQAKQEYDKIVITNHTISPAIFEIILKYIYTGRLEFFNCVGKQALELLFAADDLGLEEALGQIQEYLIYQQKDWMDKNFYIYHRSIYSRKSFSSLQNHFTTRISSNPLEVFESPESFNPMILSSLDEVGCLKLNENTWGFIVNWAKLQIPTLTTQVTKWNKSDWEEFKQTLSPCIPWKNWKFDHATSDSFIFHFDSNVSDLTRLDRFAIQRRTGYGPCFGAEESK